MSGRDRAGQGPPQEHEGEESQILGPRPLFSPSFAANSLHFYRPRLAISLPWKCVLRRERQAYAGGRRGAAHDGETGGRAFDVVGAEGAPVDQVRFAPVRT